MPKGKRVHLARQGGPKQAARHALRLEERRARVAEMYRDWKTQAEIAEVMGVSQRTISEDLAVILDEYKIRYAKAFSEYTFVELGRLNRRELDHTKVYTEAMDAWERSKGMLKSTRRIVRHVEGKDGAAGTMVPVTGQVDEQESFGDPRFLVVANKALDSMRELARLRCEMLGLYANKNLPPPNVEGDDLRHESDEALAEKFLAVTKALAQATT